MRIGHKSEAHWPPPVSKQKTIDCLREVDDLLNAPKNKLHFKGSMETAFRKECSDSRVGNFTNIGLLGLIIYNFFLFTDYYLINDYFKWDMIVHSAITPTAIAIILLVRKRYIGPEIGIIICLILALLSTSYFIAASRSDYSIFLIFTIPLIISFGTLIPPLPFRESFWFAICCIIISSLAVLMRPDWDSALGSFSIMVNVSTASYMLFGTYRAEVTERRAYLFNFRERLRADLLSSKLAQQQAVLQAILNTGPDAMLIFDHRGIISSFSPAAERLFGWNATSVVDRDIATLMTPPSYSEYKGRFDSHFKHVAPQIVTKASELVGLRKDGSVFPMMLHVGEVVLGDQRQFTGIIHDLSALREAHDRSQDLRTQLAHIWSMNSLGEMAAILAHELNQPLSAITNYMRGVRTILADDDNPNDDLLEAVDQAGTQALRAGEIIRRMRSLIARTDSDYRPESLQAMILEIDFMVRLVAREGDVAVRYDLSPERDIVFADRIQIQQVVSNLVRNASEALSGCLDRRIVISTRPSGGHWLVSVEDSGPGIAPEIAEDLFVPLATSKANGMGLGLTISRAIIDHHKGQIWIEASKLGGAFFGFTIPRHDDGKEL